ncbi:stress responsive A/B barrel domain-containing protein [Venturia nashicola]|uniref:Stress responsive A/B barrel domain-containing protein n=1 Tax=Venturia nashicola TaxID=86259 RepID=A0A4Z1NKT3_9PEZI|nr:stress responsive A/B barrel domain-containing protein [Venturia nashicola]TLD21795.1 stress responsive A/B barrel domain-containing protein [Venturia nashicola]
MTVSRTTLFKLPNEADIEAVLAAYVKLAETNSKDGKPYILSSKALKLFPDPRSQGYTLSAQTTFASVEDMRYYDEECEAHKALKDIVKPKAAGPPLMVYGEA